MSTATQVREENATETPQGGEVAVFRPPRLPYHPQIEERFGVDKAGWNALVNAVYPSAQSVDSVCMALAYCKSRQLDPFKRPVHIVPMWDSRRQGYVDTVWPGIAELRTTAARTGEYAGCDEVVFGPDREHTFKGRIKNRGSWQDAEKTVVFPEWCQLTVYRIIAGQRCAFVGPKVYWTETYATVGKSELPNEMWEKRPRGQLEKCGEAGSLRRAFPEELGNVYAAEEMHGQRIIENDALQASDITPPSPPPAPKADIPADKNEAEIEKRELPEDVEASEPVTEAAAPNQDDFPDIPPELDRREKKEPKTIEGEAEPFDPDGYLDDLEARLVSISDGDTDSFVDLRDEYHDTRDQLFPPDAEKADELIAKHEERFAP